MNEATTWFLAAGLVMMGVRAGRSWAKETGSNEVQPLLEVTTVYKNVRGPKIVVTTKGTVLAFAKGSARLRRSEDQGKTWGPEIALGRGNAVVDAKSGHVLTVDGANSRLRRSKDDGKTWTEEEIVIKPNLLGHGGTGKKPHVNGEASESGITLQYGKRKGRLLIPVRIQPPVGSNAQEHWAYNYNTSIYSDDGGKSWQVSDPVQSGTGEGTLAELSNGKLYYNSRSHLSVDHRRQIAWSHDGGHRWTDWQVSTDLLEVGQPFYFKYGTKPSYGICAGLVRLPLETTGGRDVLIFSMPDDPGGARHKMTVWASFDGAETWPVKRLVYGGPSGYSSLSADAKGNIYLLFEAGRAGKSYHERLDCARFNFEWVCNGKDWRKLAGAAK